MDQETRDWKKEYNSCNLRPSRPTNEITTPVLHNFVPRVISRLSKREMAPGNEVAVLHWAIRYHQARMYTSTEKEMVVRIYFFVGLCCRSVKDVEYGYCAF